MLRLILIIGISIPYSVAGVQCTDDMHCEEGYYCEVNYSCRRCLRCDEDFKRAPPFIQTECVKSMKDCGACLEPNSHGNNNDCGINDIPSKVRSSEGPLPVYAWILLGLLLVAVISGATLITWVNRSTYATVPTSVIQIPQGACDRVENGCAPPPYSVEVPHAINEEGEAFNVKLETFEHLDSSRESADRQATQPFSPPNYVRRPPTPTFTEEVSRINIEDQSSVDGVINVTVQSVPNVNDTIATATVRNQDPEGCPNMVSSGSNQFIDSSIPDIGTERARAGPPVVVVNNNVHLQSVSLSGASIFLPQSSTQVERR